MRALTEQETRTVDAITSGEFNNLAAMTAELDGKDIAMVVAINSDDGGETFDIAPVAILVNDDLMSRINPGEL